MIITSGIQREPHAGWETMLESDERVLWKGFSDGAIVWTFETVKRVLWYIYWNVFCLWWLYGFISESINSNLSFGSYLLPMMIGLLFLSFGIFWIIRTTYWSAYRRKRGLYILTNKRAIIMTDISLLGKKANSYPIVKDMILEYIDKDTGSIYFADENVGFERIPHAAQVYRLMLSIQYANA